MAHDLTATESRLADAVYLSSRSVADSHAARLLLSGWSALAPAEQLRQAKALLTSTALGNSVAEAIYRHVYQQEPYQGVNWSPPTGKELIELLLV